MCFSHKICHVQFNEINLKAKLKPTEKSQADEHVLCIIKCVV